ncbi:vesicle transport protein GOT1 isoform X1 [Physcomitrium patens]|uniref:vesicle transport protein GOT1 isoform X1 n=1 Tax=Physcomitrium patens TaxID=3218 RepID=UPI0001622F97|nr:vesicle transport protein GOT1-like isoform X1 [Physcomitrium patens]|eukprot:XP_024391991.1 vesicle transport protein GOT1-like isoform X1 [Physcomitrella patens]
MVGFEMNDRRKIGIGLTGFGVLFTFLGVVFFFDKGLLAMGNILFVAGVMITIGIKGTVSFFLKPRNYKGSILFAAGFALVIFGWAIVGMLIETYGFVLLFSGFWPTALVFLYRVPILGNILRQPFFTSFFDRFRERRVPV